LICKIFRTKYYKPHYFLIKIQHMRNVMKSLLNHQTYYLSVFLLLIVFIPKIANGQSSANYTYSTSATGSLALDANGNSIDMSSGTTQIVGPGLDASTGTGITNIGFTFIFMGNVFTQFSVQEDGILQLGSTLVPTNTYTINGGSLTSPRLSAFNADFRTGTTTGKIHYKLIGTAPNRTLIVEFKDMQLFYTFPGTAGTSTWQMRLYETSGILEYIYGAMSATDVTTGSRSPSIGFYTGAATNSFASILYASHTNSNTSPYAANPAVSVTGDITDLNSTTDGSRRIYKYTPGSAPVAPTWATPTLVTTNGMTLNWVDNASDETGYIILRSTDNVTFTQQGSTLAPNTQTLAVTSLSAGTLYYWRILAIKEGTSSEATGNQATLAGATYYWVGTSGSTWNTAANWNTMVDGSGSSRSTPATTDVLIVDGAGTTAGTATTISVDLASFSIGQFKVTDNTACTLQSSVTTTRTITITGGPANDFIIESGSTLNLTNATMAVAFAFSGTGNAGDISGTLNFAGSTSNLLTTTGGTGTLVSVSATGIVNLGATGNSLVGSVATLSFLDGANCNSTGATTGAPPVPLATWATTSNLTITGITTSTTAPTNNAQSFGNLTYNCPLASGTMSFFTSTTTAIIKGNFTITAGATGGTGIFRAVTSGTVTINGNVIVNQGRLQSASGAGTFIVLGNTTNNANGIIDILAGTYSQRGATFTNDGIITGPAGTLQFLNFTGSFSQTLAGSGTVLTNLATLSLQNTSGLTISHNNQIILARVNLFQGTITNSNKITIGTGAAVSCITQIGSVGLTTPGGSFSSAPVFNLGTGTYSLIYQQESVSRTTGFEIPSSRAVTNVTINNTNGVTLNGGDLTLGTTSVVGLLTLTAGIFNANGSSVILPNTGTTLSGGSSSSYVDGKLVRSFPASRTASGTYTTTTFYPIGKSGNYLPIYIDPTTTSGGSVTFSGEAFLTNSGTFGSGVSTLSSTRWEALPVSGSANLTNSFIRLTDGAILASNKILQSATASGAYVSIAPVSTYSAGPPATLTTATSLPTTSYNGYFAYGDITPCTVPTNQPTVLTFSNLGGTSLTGTFTAAIGTPSHYLVVRYPNLGSVTDPVDFTQYTIGTILGAGVVRGVLTSPTVSFNDSGLSAGTTYDYYVYSYNNSACNGPVYLISSPLKASVTTCVSTTGTPGTPTASSVGITSFTASWTASSTPGVNYYVDVATDVGFTNFVGVYNGLNVGGLLSIPVSSLSGNTTYYVRVRADLAGCVSVNSGTLTVTTECIATSTFPATEPFTTYLPSTCWKEGDLGDLTAGPSVIASSISSWTSDGFLNSGSTGAAVINIFSSADSDWLISPFYTIPASGYRVKYSVGATQFGATTAPTTPWETDDFVELVVSNGTTNWTVLKTYNSTNVPSHLGQVDITDISAYNGQTVRFAFRAVEGATNGDADIDFFIDNFTIELTPTDAVDWGNLQFPGSGTIYTTNAFDTYGQTYEPGVTEGAGQGTGVLAWLGYNNADTDPNTWTNWIPATFNVQVGNNDEFIGTIPANTLTPGTYYYAYRYQLSGGPFVYGGYKASGGGIWDGSNNVSGVLTVNACPSVSASATMTTICQNTSTTISATSANPNYTYQWNPGSLVGASHLVSPSSSTSYVVTATDLGIACSSTASVSVNVVSGPSNVTANASPATICVGGSTNLLGDANPNTVLLSESFESGLPSGWSVVNGGTGNNWTFPLSLSGSARTGTRAAQYTYNSLNPANTWLFTTGQNLTAGVTYTISSWYRTSSGFPEKLKVTVGSDATILGQTTVIQDLGTIQTATYTEQTATFTPVTTGVYYFAWNAYSDADEFFINLDDISITTPAMLSYNWTSTPSGFTSMSQNPTGIAPLVNTLYNLSVTDSNTGCANTASVNVQFATSAIVSSSADSGAGTLRAAIECLGEGGTITYDQPTTAATVLTTPLNITKSVTIQGLSSASRPEITVPAAGVSIDATKTLTLQNVDVKSSGSDTFTGTGDVSITGTTVGKQ
jgi:hypothetical protein